MIDLNEALAIMAPNGKSVETRYHQRAAIALVRVVRTTRGIESLPDGFGGPTVRGIWGIAANVGDLRPARPPLCRIARPFPPTALIDRSYHERQCKASKPYPVIRSPDG